MSDLKRLAEAVESLARRNKSSAGFTVPVPRVPEDDDDNSAGRPTTQSQMQAVMQQRELAAQAPRVPEVIADDRNNRPLTQNVARMIEHAQTVDDGEHSTEGATGGNGDRTTEGAAASGANSGVLE